MNNPFKNLEETLNALRAYEDLRSTTEVNMFALAEYWDHAELQYIMSLYTTGEAKRLLAG